MAGITPRSGTRMTGAQLLAELEAIRVAAGELTGELVVAAATPKSHPLHSRFEWDDKVAGHRYRVEQGNELIRSVQIEYVDRGGLPQKVRGYVSVTRSARPSYELTTEVAQDPVVARLVLQTAEREWRTLFARYGHLEEFIALVKNDTAVQAA